MSNLSTVTKLRRTALEPLTMLRGLSPQDQLTPLWTSVRYREVEDHLAILDRYAMVLPCPAEREAARQAAEEVRAGRDRAPVD